MKASVGDRIVIHGRTVDSADRGGEILEVHGPDGTPPYVVRWQADGHLALCFPGPDAQVEPRRRADSAECDDPKPSSAEPRLDMAAVARWGRTHGHVISDNRVPRSVLDAYLRTH